MNFPTHITPILPLENGDKLSRDEFERRYNAMPNLKKAELVEGIVDIKRWVLLCSTHPTKCLNLIAWC
jgi:hypothetical protein